MPPVRRSRNRASLPHLLESVGEVRGLGLALEVHEANRGHVRRLPRQHRRQAERRATCGAERGRTEAGAWLSLPENTRARARQPAWAAQAETASRQRTRVQQFIRVQMQQPMHAVSTSQPQRLALAIPAPRAGGGGRWLWLGLQGQPCTALHTRRVAPAHPCLTISSKLTGWPPHCRVLSSPALRVYRSYRAAAAA